MSNSHESTQPFPFTVDSSMIDAPKEHTGYYTSGQFSSATIISTYQNNKEAHRPHIEASRRTITAAAQAAIDQCPDPSQSRAIFLGPGPCLDLPAEEIVGMFDHTTFVEFDAPTTASALADLPEELRSKATLIRADVGQSIEFRQIFQESSASLLRYTTTVIDGLKALNKRPLPVIGEKAGYDFVCSQLLLTSMTAMAVSSTMHSLRQRQELALFQDATSRYYGPVQDALKTYRDAHNLKHLDQLGSLVNSTGLVHFADTFSSTRRVGETLYRAKGVNESFEDEIEKRFHHVVPPEKWDWAVAPDLGTVVTAYLLRSRSDQEQVFSDGKRRWFSSRNRAQ